MDWFKTYASVHTEVEHNKDNDALASLFPGAKLSESIQSGDNIDNRLPAESSVPLEVYDALGREVAAIVNGYEQAVAYSVELPEFISRRSSGVCFYSLRGGSFVQTKKMVPVR